MPKEKRIKIFIVAPLNSIHTVRWIGQLSNQGWEIHLFPAEDIYSFHPELLHHIIHIPFSAYFHFMEKFRCKRVFDFFFRVYRDVRTRYGSKYFYKRLRRRIKMIKPHLIHSMETQGAGYLIAKVRSDYMSDFSFPLWWHTLWGSDIYLYRRLSAHRLRIEEVVKLCDFISADCMRDQKIVAAEYNVESKILALTHATCGFDIINLTRLQKSHIPTSERTIILLKGYQGWSGRALVGFRALCRCRDIIGKYKLVVFSNTSMETIRIAAELFQQDTGISVQLLSEDTPHEVLLEYQSKARVTIGLGISDGMPNSVLEAMAMGSFPIQSNTSAADEWFKDGIGGILVPPEDVEVIEKAIRTALQDDDLVDKAANINLEVIKNRADYNLLKSEAVKTYEKLLKIER